MKKFFSWCLDGGKNVITKKVKQGEGKIKLETLHCAAPSAQHMVRTNPKTGGTYKKRKIHFYWEEEVRKKTSKWEHNKRKKKYNKEPQRSRGVEIPHEASSTKHLKKVPLLGQMS